MRDQIIDYLKNELIGPDPIDPLIQENGEEILLESPAQRYATGILFPQKTEITETPTTDEKDTESEPDSEIEDKDPEEPKSVDISTSNSGYFDEGDKNDEILNLANEYFPSAMGFSCRLNPPKNGLKITVFAGIYSLKPLISSMKQTSGSKVSGYFREQLKKEFEIIFDPTSNKRGIKRFPIFGDSTDGGLVLYMVRRGVTKSYEDDLYSFCLVNEYSDSSRKDSSKHFFQVSLVVESTDGEGCFNQYSENSQFMDEETLAREFLYRERGIYAVGHGCSPEWNTEKNRKVFRIETKTIPIADIKPVLPTEIHGLSLSMSDLSKDDLNNIVATLNQLADKYEEWIEGESKKLPNDSIWEKIAEKNLSECNACLFRIREGINILKSNNIAFKSFLMMNTAMLLQQLHSNLPFRTIVGIDQNISSPYLEPLIHDRKSWPKENLGTWFPFQIAFILMNIKSLTEPTSNDRNVVDLIWFPTRGGKTEAYLGLSAFSIFYRRFQNPLDDGTVVLMRYTLRLLTAQQFQRASALICACELLRQNNPTELGSSPITVGVWAGGRLSPNTCKDALLAHNELLQGKSENNPFILYKCPWCGIQMGPVKIGRNSFITPGYRTDHGTVIFRCVDKNCFFSRGNLPVLVIDEDIYKNPPAIIVGTVDKFAMLTWNPETILRIFGFRPDKKIDPPELIIQDELHLISGPLGSITGIFETLIDELCKKQINNKDVYAKVIASTATVSRAKEQIKSLYNRPEKNISIFPPQGLRAGESFFAHEEINKAGRRYIGIHASGFSHPTIHVRTVSALLQAAKTIEAPDEEKNYYWTILDYFNSLRELGYASTRIHADMREYMRRMWERKRMSKTEKGDLRRHITKVIEMTGRIESNKIPQSLKELEVNYSLQSLSFAEKAVDICQATNMISVGVDISRLGLMTVMGQPKTTSEYIQATSRVGRDSKGPGLVVAVYNPMKPRDRSFYERFNSYHNRIYAFVEPMSVTPFSPRVTERMLHSVLIGLVRYLGTEGERNSPKNFISIQLREKITDIIIKRVDNIQPEESDQTKKLINRIFDRWNKLRPSNYFSNSEPFESVLMYRSNQIPHDAQTKLRAWSTPQSMRNVDAECNLQIISSYGEDYE